MLANRLGQFIGHCGPAREHAILIDYGLKAFCNSYKTSRKASTRILVSQQASSVAGSDNVCVLHAPCCGDQNCFYWMVSTGRHASLSK